MRIISPKFDIMKPDPDDQLAGINILQEIEEIARTCYKSEDKITEESAEKFVKGLVKRKHFPMLDHIPIRVRFTCDRGVTHEIVRHRIAAYAQESTRYCNYSKEKYGQHITYIKPSFLPKLPTGVFMYADEVATGFLDGELPKDHKKEMNLYYGWIEAMLFCETSYFRMVNLGGASPGQARSVLPNSLKTEIVCTLDITAWRHFFSLRTVGGAHEQMRELTQPLLGKLRGIIPIVFDDVGSVNEKAPPGV